MAASNAEKQRATKDDSSLSASKRQKSFPTSSSGGNSQWKYEVFLSFRGEDTRNNFTDHLLAALDHKGIYTFRDDERLERGKEISSELLEAIERSIVSVIILSENYAFSTWCLDELAKIVECMKAKDQIVLPVFYKVRPSDVREQKGAFKKAFEKHEQVFRDNLEQVKKWRSALSQVANLSGWHSNDRSEAKLITDIVDDIGKRLNQIQYFPSVDGRLVGIDCRVEEIYELLRPDIFDEIRFVGIYGMGGIGKTTLARVVYERLSYKYEGSCFLANVREVSEKEGIKSLQEKLLYEVLKEKDLNIYDCYKAISLIRKRLCKKKIFLVLDDVDQLEQLKWLAEREDWFGSGSRIIITTRDEHVLTSHEINNIYKVEGLDYNEAYKLFCMKALKGIEPANDQVELSNCVVYHANGLPLALEVLGSFLCGKSVNEWKSALRRLEAAPHPDIVKILRISYDGLQWMEKKIFLDIACFFKGKDINRIMKILDSCNFHPVIGIKVLVERSLITIKDNKLQMHDLVQRMGWQVVCEQHPDEPGKWSRLWLCQDVHNVLARNMGTPAVEAMIMFKYNKNIIHAKGKCFSTMSNLRLLDINNVHIFEDLKFLSNELRFLKWRGYPLKTLPSSFHPQKLFELNLCYSHIKYLWNGSKPFLELTTIKLSYSQNLVRTPDFTMIPNLERLDLQHCTRLLEVHHSVGFLKRLVILNLNKCKNLVKFPSDVCGLKSLQILNLYGCSKLDKLPLNLEEIEHLEELDVAGTAIRQVPPSIVQLTNLRTLSFRGCKGGPPATWSSFLLSRLLPSRKPTSMHLLLPPLANLSSLQILDLSDCNLLDGAFPRDLGSLYSLRELNISGNNFVSLPDTIGQLSKLEVLCLEKCHRLQSLPKLPPGLISVRTDDCTSLKTISSLLELTSSAIGLEFLNCFSLDETQGSNKDSLATVLLKHCLQISVRRNHNPFSCGSSSYSEFYIRLPGSEIPKFFNCQNEGNDIYGILPDGWFNDEFIGFALCGVFSPGDYPYRSMITASDFDARFSTMKSDHLWLAYLSRERVFCAQESHIAHFRIGYGNGALVKRCGIRPLYKHDVEYLEDLSATDVGIRKVQKGFLHGWGSGWAVSPPHKQTDSGLIKSYPGPLFYLSFAYREPHDANQKEQLQECYRLNKLHGRRALIKWHTTHVRTKNGHLDFWPSSFSPSRPCPCLASPAARGRPTISDRWDKREWTCSYSFTFY